MKTESTVKNNNSIHVEDDLNVETVSPVKSSRSAGTLPAKTRALFSLAMQHNQKLGESLPRQLQNDVHEITPKSLSPIYLAPIHKARNSQCAQRCPQEMINEKDCCNTTQVDSNVPSEDITICPKEYRIACGLDNQTPEVEPIPSTFRMTPDR